MKHLAVLKDEADPRVPSDLGLPVNWKENTQLKKLIANRDRKSHDLTRAGEELKKAELLFRKLQMQEREAKGRGQTAKHKQLQRQLEEVDLQICQLNVRIADLQRDIEDLDVDIREAEQHAKQTESAEHRLLRISSLKAMIRYVEKYEEERLKYIASCHAERDHLVNHSQTDLVALHSEQSPRAYSANLSMELWLKSAKELMRELDGKKK